MCDGLMISWLTGLGKAPLCNRCSCSLQVPFTLYMEAGCRHFGQAELPPAEPQSPMALPGLH